MRVFPVFAAVVLSSVLLLSGCSSGSLQGALPSGNAALPVAAISKAGVKTVPHHGRGKIVLRIHWKHRKSHRRPHYLPATARSISISINGGTAQYANSPTSTLTVTAPGGTDTFYIATYDEQNGQGNVLSKAYVTQNIIAGQANAISVTLNAVIATFSVALAEANLAAGTAASTAINVTPYDADGNIIVGSSDYAAPISLSISDPAKTGTLSLTSAILQNPGSTASLTYNGGTLVNASVVAQVQGAGSQSATFAPTPTVYEFPVTGSPQYISRGPDGNMYFTNSNNTVVKITKTGIISPFTIPTNNANPQGITLGENGSLWFTEFSSSKIGEMTTSGSFNEFGTLFGGDTPRMLTDRGDGTIWYTGSAENHIGYVDESIGLAGETTLPTGGSEPWGIAEGPQNGQLYVTENANNEFAYISNLFGTFSQFPVPANSGSESIVKGPDGNMWFTLSGLDSIGRINVASNTVTQFFTASPSSAPVDITVGTDNELWYTESGTDRIGRMTADGIATEFDVISSNTRLIGIAAALDGSIWFCESNTSKVGRLVY
jgi:virginiamycin B lyase